MRGYEGACLAGFARVGEDVVSGMLALSAARGGDGLGFDGEVLAAEVGCEEVIYGVFVVSY